MSPKAGILHDYDLMANAEPSVVRILRCAGCDAEPPRFQWSDYSGEAMCTRCGCPYQLKWGSDQQMAEGAYPYLSLRDELVEPLRAYFAETGQFTCLGVMLGPRPGMDAFAAWLQNNRLAIYEALTAERQDDQPADEPAAEVPA